MAAIDFMLAHDPVAYVRGYYKPVHGGRADCRRTFEHHAALSDDPEALRAWHERGLTVVVPEE